MKVSKLDLHIILLWFAFFPFYLPNQKIYYMYQFIIACIIFMESFMEIRRKPNYLVGFLYPIAIVISCIVNRNTIQYTQVVRGFASALLIIDVFLIVTRYERTRGVEKLFGILYGMSKFYVLMNVLWIMFLLLMGNLQSAIKEEFLFSRGKFSTAYMFIFYLMFFGLIWNGNHYISKRWKKPLFIIQAIGCMGICMLIETSTGIVAILVFLIGTFYGNRVIRIIENPFAIVAVIIGTMFLIFYLEIILQFSFVRHVIVNVLHENLGLTGRIELYSMLYPLILKSGLWGGGFGSYVAETLAYHGWYNAQNGLAEIILTYGFLGGATFLTLVFVSVRSAKNKNKMLYLAVFTFIVVAIVEIPFNNIGFILLLALLQVQYDKKSDFIKVRKR